MQTDIFLLGIHKTENTFAPYRHNKYSPHSGKNTNASIRALRAGAKKYGNQDVLISSGDWCNMSTYPHY